MSSFTRILLAPKKNRYRLKLIYSTVSEIMVSTKIGFKLFLSTLAIPFSVVEMALTKFDESAYRSRGITVNPCCRLQLQPEDSSQLRRAIIARSPLGLKYSTINVFV